MNSISQTIDRLSALRGMMGSNPGAPGHIRLSDLRDSSSNPGQLRARIFVPDELAAGAALVVVLHGCTQTAAGYDQGSGWSTLAEKDGFALLFPEQQRSNNPNLCFNWFVPGDASRDQGEALSIRQMVDAMIAQYRVDPARVFVTGLSAGGAMASVMLATYPEVFAGGAVIAGLPYGAALSVQDALVRMRGQGLPTESRLTALAKGASNYTGPWPSLSVWHGDADHIVSPLNAEALLAQWRGLHGLAAAPSHVEHLTGYRRRLWQDDAGRDVIEDYLIAGMGHGTPLNTGGEDGCGVAGPHMLDVGLSSTRLIAARWGIAGALKPPIQTNAKAPSVGTPATNEQRPFQMPGGLGADIERTINDALRTAGLLR